MLVNNVTNLQAMSTNLAGNYALGTTIDATATSGWNAGAGFIPVGDATTHFTGNFDGMGNTIDGLTINRPTTDYVGLFGYIGSGTNIKNVTLTNVNITGQQYVGGLVGTSYFSTMDGVTIGGTVSGLNYVGGLLGDSIYLGSVLNSNSSVNVTATGSNVGGLVGRSQIYSAITNSTASGTVSSVGSFNVGGLVGYSGFNSTISGSTSSGAVTGARYVGGLVGRNAGGITTSSSSSIVTGAGATNWEVGGLAGYNVWAGYSGTGTVECSFSCASTTYGNISGSFATGNVTGYSNVGGLVGYNNSGASISGNSYASGAVSGNNYVGGMTGYNMGSISTTYAAGSVTGSGAANNNLGGLVGYNGGTINASYASGVTVSGNFYVGGLVGFNQSVISNSYVSTGNVTGSTTVGGLVGYNNSTITNSYVDGGSITATRQIGGLTGTSPGTLTNSHYNIDTVLLNGGALVTRSGIYNTQYAAWVAGGYVALNIANYSSSLPFNVTAYQVGTVQSLRDMLAFADNPAYSFIMTSSIDLAPASGLYIPYLAAASFDGAGFTISNLNIDVPNAGMGMFGTTAAGTTVTNLAMQDATVNGASAVGSIVGLNNGALSNSHSSRSATGLISGNSSVGGLVGSNGFGATITNSYVSSGAVTASVRNIGGLVGSDGGTRTNSYFDIDNVTTNGGNNVTVGGLYNTGGVGQFNGWFSGGTLTPLSIANYSTTLVLQGDGSYGIGTQQGLKDMLGFAENPAYNFSLTAGINLTGMSGYYVPKLAGDFNGNAFSISNLSLTLPNDDMGLFGSIALGSTVSNLNLVNVAVSGLTNVGAVAGSNYGNIDTVTVSGTPLTVNGESNVGGMVGRNVSSGSTTVAGDLTGGNVSNSSVNGGAVSASAAGNSVGGLVGWNTGNITNSDVLNTAVSGSNTVGGLVGYNNGAATPSAVVFSGIISGSTVTNGSVTGNGGIGSSGIGGLVGNNFEGVIVGSYVINPTVNGGAADGVGGLVGNNSVGAYGFAFPGGSYSISNSYVSGGTVDSTGNNIGGLAGYIFGAPINASYVDSAVVNGGISVGGLVGYDSGEGWNGGLGLIGNSFVSNTQVTGTSQVGGMVGEVRLPTTGSGGVDNYVAILNSYVSGGTVSGTTDVGGLVGRNAGEISMAYTASGLVNGTTNVGGLIGYNNITAVVSNSFWDIDTTGRGLGAGFGQDLGYINTAGVAGLTTVERMTMSSFVGWSIANTGGAGMIWRIYEGQTGPLLTSFLTPLTATANSGNRPYDGTTDGLGVTYSSTPNANLLGTVVAQTASPNAGTYTVTPSGLYSNALGYDISYANGTVGITSASLTLLLNLTANDASKTYGTTLTFNGTEFTPVGLVGGDFISNLGLTSDGAVDTANAGTYLINVTPESEIFGQGLASNYDITYQSGVLTVNPATLTYTANASTQVYGDAAPAFSGSVSGFVLGQTLATATTGTLGFSTSALANSNVGSYYINGSGLTANNGNYVFAQAAGNSSAFTITPRDITIAVDSSLTKTYGSADNLTFTVGGLGLASFDTNAAVSTAVTRPAGENVGTYAVTQGTLTNGNYNVTTFAGSTLDITPASLTVTANDLSKYEGMADPALTYTVNGLQFGETAGATFTGSQVRDPGEDVGAYAITQGSLTLASSNYVLASYVPGTFTVMDVPPITPPILSKLVMSILVADGNQDKKQDEDEKQDDGGGAVFEVARSNTGGNSGSLPVCQ